MSTSKLDLAREWARKYQRHHVIGSENELAAVEVIQSLPDHIIDLEKASELADDMANWSLPDGLNNAADDFRHLIKILGGFSDRLNDLLPQPPQPRTLADMSLEELKTHVGGEVMVDGWANPTMLVSVIEDEGAVLARRLNKPWPFVEVRPLSDLTPVAAPEQEAESAPESTLPRPEDVPPGEWWSVRYYGREWAGVRSDHEISDHGIGPWSIISMDGLDYRDVDDSDITLMFCLVPEIP